MTTSNKPTLADLLAAPPEDRPAPATVARRARLPVNKIAAVLTWLGGVSTTYLALHAMLPDMPLWLCAIIAAGAQAILTLGERPTLGGRPSLVGAGALAIDTVLNAGGLFGPLLRIGATPPGQMVAAVTHQATVTPGVAAAVAVVLGLFIAALPEWFWRQPD